MTLKEEVSKQIKTLESQLVLLKKLQQLEEPAPKKKPIALPSPSAAVSPDEILAYVHRNPGLRLEKIAQGLGVNSKGLKAPVALLVLEKRLSKKGNRRGTTYFPGEKQ